MDLTETLLSLALGVGLAAAVGLRVFLPLLVLSVGAMSGHLQLATSFQWLASWPAVLTLGVATLAEVTAYYLPGVDHLLDVIATPVAIVAGSIAAAAVMTDLPPLVKWTTAIIAGGGAAGLTQGLSALLRVKSTATTGGLGNPLVATGELGGSLLLSLLAVFTPVLALAAVVLCLWVVLRFARRLLRRSSTAGNAAS
jgi:hypothetical protein